jgi:hypothetical protein
MIDLKGRGRSLTSALLSDGGVGLFISEPQMLPVDDRITATPPSQMINNGFINIFNVVIYLLGISKYSFQFSVKIW